MGTALHLLASGPGWSVRDIVCGAGPHDRPFEEQHEDICIAAVTQGTFQYRSRQGSAVLAPGALLLGNAGSCFECGHEHGTGDRCIAFQFTPEYFAEIAATVAGSHRFRFPAAMVPAIRDLPVPFIDAEALTAGGGSIALDEMAVRLAEIVLGA